MFKNTLSFNQDLLNISVHNVTNMDEMFLGSPIFNQNITSWAVQSICSLTNMFTDAIEMIQKYKNKNNFNDDGNYTPNYKFFNKTKLLYCWDFRSQNYRNSWKDSLGVIRDIENNTNAEIKTHGITTSTHERRDDGIHLNNDDYNNITNPGGVYIDLVGIDDSTYISDAFTIEIVAKFDSNQRIGHNGINSGNLFDFSNEDGDNRIYSKRGDTNKKLELVINDTTNINVTT